MSFLSQINRNVKIYIAANGFYYAGYSVVGAFLSLLITAQITGNRLDLVGYVLSFYMIVRSIAEIPISRITRRYSFLTKRNIIVTCYCLYAFLLFILGHATEIWHVFFIQALTGLLDATAYPIKWTIFTKIIDGSDRELAWSLEDISSTLLPAIFTAIAGLVSASFGISYAFLIFALLLLLSSILFISIKTDRNTEAAFRWIVSLLRKRNIPFQIAGGFSARLYGVNRELADIDFEIPEDRFEELLPDVKPYIKWGPGQYKDENWDLKLMTLTYEGQEIDIAGAYENKIFDQNIKHWVELRSDLSKTKPIEVYGITVPVIPREDLIAYKSKLRREVDLIDVAQLTNTR